MLNESTLTLTDFFNKLRKDIPHWNTVKYATVYGVIKNKQIFTEEEIDKHMEEIMNEHSKQIKERTAKSSNLLSKV